MNLILRILRHLYSAQKLTGDGVSAVLQCIDAKQTLKKLKLAGCANVTGRSLQSLQEYTTLQLIDISL